jgi:DNA-binding GntR family transcriptional regulator
VPRLGVDDASDLFVVRRLLELNVVETLVDEGFAQLPSGARCEHSRRSTTMTAGARFVVHDFALHQALVDDVGSPRMSRIYAGTAEEIRLALAQLRRAYTSPSEISAEHRTPVEAICSNDRERALEVARGHLDASERILVDQHDPSERRTAHGR